MSLTDGELYDFVIAVDYKGQPHVVEEPEGYELWEAKTREDADNRIVFAGLPVVPGVYRAIAKFWKRKAYATLGVMRQNYTLSGFHVVQYEPMHLRPSGEFVPVPTETEDEERRP